MAGGEKSRMGESKGMTEWSLLDFAGKYHRRTIKAKYPIPGTAVAVEEKRERGEAEREKGLNKKIDEIHNRYGKNIGQKCHQAEVEWQIELQRRVGGTISKTGAILQKMENEVALQEKERLGLDWRRKTKQNLFQSRLIVSPNLDDGEYEGERNEIQQRNAAIADAEEAALAAEGARAALAANALELEWWKHVLDFNVERMEACLKAGYDCIDISIPEKVAKQLNTVEPLLLDDEASIVTTTTVQSHGQQHAASHHNNPLHLAVRFGHVEMAELLLAYGADANAENGLGDTAILLAWLFWSPSHAQQRDNLRRPDIQRAALANEEKTLRILAALLRHGARPNSRRSDMSTALHEAARRGPVHAVKLLLDFGADHLQRDTSGQTPIDLAHDALKRQRVSLFKSNPPSPGNIDDHTTSLVRHTGEDKANASLLALAKDKINYLQEIYRLLSNCGTIRQEKKYHEFYQDWQAWLKQDKKTRSLRMGDDKPVECILDQVQLELSRRALTLSMLQRDNDGQPFWSYDAVRRSVSCPKTTIETAAATELEHFLENSPTAITPAQRPGILATTGMPMPEKELAERRQSAIELSMQRRASRARFNGDQSLTSMRRAPRDRPASKTQKLSVGLDRYLLREVEARDLGFVETLDMSRIAKTDKDILLEKIRERAAAKSLQERKSASSLAKTKGKNSTTDATASNVVLRGRLAAADRVLADAYRSTEHLATRRSLFRAAATKTSRIPAINNIYTDLAELRLYNQISTEQKRIQAHNPLQLARAQLELQQNNTTVHSTIPVSLELGAANRCRVQSETSKINELGHLPPRGESISSMAATSHQDDASSQGAASSISLQALLKRHKSKKKPYPWDFRPYDQHDEPKLDYMNRLQKPHDRDINSMIEFAADLGQRPRNTPLLLTV